MIEVINRMGGTGVQEVLYVSEPDIIFELHGLKWILSVKIGETPQIIKEAFLQYLRHKSESNIKHGILFLFCESIRNVSVDQNTLRQAIEKKRAKAFIDADIVKQEIKNITFPETMELLINEVIPQIKKKEPVYNYSLNSVIALLQHQVVEMMGEISLKQKQVLEIVADEHLLMDLGNVDMPESADIARFLASYILMSQILFFRLFYSECPEIFDEPKGKINREYLYKSFKKILDINYKPIYSLNTLDLIPERFITDTFQLIWGLEIENVKYELPGRIFHELMPAYIRKMLAAFYTRPQAADVLANLTISSSEESVFDPACGSGTILVSAYRRKLNLHAKEKKSGNPHKQFCENDIYGADIMPFAVHLTSSNLASLDIKTQINRTQIVQGDSIKMVPANRFRAGLIMDLFPQQIKAKTMNGDPYDITIENIDTILMNPPFTKIERGIAKYIDLEKFKGQVGGEVGLWGHFIALADLFLKNDGAFGAVIPINILRGRESKKIREILFKKMTPLYILKPVQNYAFSEWAEYRDVILVAKKRKPTEDSKVKFCLIKKNLSEMTKQDSEMISRSIINNDNLRSTDVDVKTFKMEHIWERLSNMMWLCGTTDYSHHDVLYSFIESFSGKLEKIPKDRIATGFRPDKNITKILFLTRQSSDSRTEQAFLRFQDEDLRIVKGVSPFNIEYAIEKKFLKKSLRTPVGIKTMDVTNGLDYIATNSYKHLKSVCLASDFPDKSMAEWMQFWKKIQKETNNKETHLAIPRRINPYSDETCVIGVYSDDKYSPSDQFNIFIDEDPKITKSLAVILNSTIFLSQFFLSKEESTGRYIDIRLYDLLEMNLYPQNQYVSTLSSVFEKYKDVAFPSLREQFDGNFERRYKAYWKLENREEEEQKYIDEKIKPFKQRIAFDMDVCKAMKLRINREDLLKIYDVFIKEMIITRHLARD